MITIVQKYFESKFMSKMQSGVWKTLRIEKMPEQGCNQIVLVQQSCFCFISVIIYFGVRLTNMPRSQSLKHYRKPVIKQNCRKLNQNCLAQKEILRNIEKGSSVCFILYTDLVFFNCVLCCPSLRGEIRQSCNNFSTTLQECCKYKVGSSE